MREEIEPLPLPPSSVRGPLIALILVIVGILAAYRLELGCLITVVALCVAAGIAVGRPLAGISVGVILIVILGVFAAILALMLGNA
jgi:hypothetical protein